MHGRRSAAIPFLRLALTLVACSSFKSVQPPLRPFPHETHVDGARFLTAVSLMERECLSGVSVRSIGKNLREFSIEWNRCLSKETKLRSFTQRYGISEFSPVSSGCILAGIEPIDLIMVDLIGSKNADTVAADLVASACMTDEKWITYSGTDADAKRAELQCLFNNAAGVERIIKVLNDYEADDDALVAAYDRELAACLR